MRETQEFIIFDLFAVLHFETVDNNDDYALDRHNESPALSL